MHQHGLSGLQAGFSTRLNQAVIQASGRLAASTQDSQSGLAMAKASSSSAYSA